MPRAFDGQSMGTLWSMDIPCMLYGHSMDALWTFYVCCMYVPSVEVLWMFMDIPMDVPWTFYECLVDNRLMFRGHSLCMFYVHSMEIYGHSMDVRLAFYGYSRVSIPRT